MNFFDPFANTAEPGMNEILIGDKTYQRGDKVILRLGKRRSDAADMLVDNKKATIENILSDYEDKIYFAVTVDDDPGQQMLREMKIYRYFLTDEVELINHGN